MLHLYCGEGKGKTTSALGLAMRASGRGLRVLFVQFLKNGSGGEIENLKSLPNITYMVYNDISCFTFAMSETQKKECIAANNGMIKQAAERAADFDMFVFDELIGALDLGFADRVLVFDFLRNNPNKEIVLTGRKPDSELLETADYVSEIKSIKHPYNKGIKAREGIEF